MPRSSPRSVVTATLRRIHILIFLFSFGIAVPAYIESSFLEERLGKDRVGLLFTAAYLMAIVAMVFLPKLIRRFGKRRSFTLSAILLAVSVLLLALPIPAIAAIMSFVVMTVMLWLVTYGFDLAMEQHTTNAKTGTQRGMYLTIMNLGWVFSPIAMGLVGDGLGIAKVFAVSFLFLLPVAIFFPSIWKSSDDRTVHEHGELWKGIVDILSKDSLWTIIVLAFLLQFFYSWMVIYLPLYLSQDIGFSWGTIGTIFAVMLLPFVIFEYPAGRIADRWLGEKELLSAGILIMAVASIAINWVSPLSVLGWMAVLFATRMGASIVESMRDSYFYKHVDSDDVVIMGVFHMVWLLAYVIGPLVATMLLTTIGYGELFPILGGLLLLIAAPALWWLPDTK